MKRRTFLSTTAALGASASRVQATRAPTVVAQPTVFYAHDGERSLVRFTITGLDAPAGRLRIYDTRSRLIGTAGVINTGVELVGELWLRLGSNLTLVSALEAPGLRGVHRTTHRVPQGPRWTIHWLTIADPSQIDRVIGTAPPHTQAIRGSIARAAGVHANPGNPITFLATDPLDAFESVRAAGSAQVHGLPTSRVALETSGNRLDQTSVMMLAGSGVEYVIRPWHGGAPHEWWEGMDGSRILAIPQAPSGDLGSLGFDESATTAQARVDRWLAGSPIHLAPLDANGRVTNDRITYVIDTDIERAADRKIAVDEWNARFGYPRVVMGPPDNPLDVAHQSRESIPSIRTTRTSPHLDTLKLFCRKIILSTH